MNERDDVGTRLTRALHVEAEQVRPEPRLQSILARTRRAPARRSRWWPVVGGALAAGALVAAFAFVVLDDQATVEPPVASTSAVTLYFVNPDGRLVAEQVTWVDTGDPGVDAVNALLGSEPTDPDYRNDGWVCEGRALEATSVASQRGVVVVTLSVQSDPPDTACQGFTPMDQQMVHTAQAALHSREPVSVIVTDAWSRKPTKADPYALAPVQIESPSQDDVVSSPVTFSGQSATFEATVVWRVKQDGEVVKDGFTTSEGANGVLGPFAFTVDLPPGDYTVEAYEESAENGDVINLDSKDFTVE